MKPLKSIFQYEFKHLVRSPFKIIALLMFIGAAVYGLENGYTLLKKQSLEIETIKTKDKKSLDEIIGWYDTGKKGLEERPWIDISKVSYAITLCPITAVKSPSALMPLSIGQAEQFGYYKNIGMNSSVLDADLSEEIANPERLALGTLDFSFTILYLLPILACILLFNIGGLEKDLNFDRLIAVNGPTRSKYLATRVGFYFILTISILALLIFIYGARSMALKETPAAFAKFVVLIIFYSFLWFAAFYLIMLKGKGSADQALKMASLWLFLCIIMPGISHQFLSLKYPTNYMTEYLDAQRKETFKLYDLPADSLHQQILVLYPDLLETKLAKDSVPNMAIISNSRSSISNKLIKKAALHIEQKNEAKNRLIKRLYLLNPISYFQNTMNSLSETDYYSYKSYRDEIQVKIDQKIDIMLFDNWNKISVDKEKFLEYLEKFDR